MMFISAKADIGSSMSSKVSVLIIFRLLVMLRKKGFIVFMGMVDLTEVQ